MKSEKVFIAVDLGAGSGRVLAGELADGSIELVELNRFANEPKQLSSGDHWDIEALFRGILEGLSAAAERYGDRVVSIGVDTWGVDYGLLDSSGELVEPPFMYRDSRTDGMIDAACAIVPREEIYEKTGIQFMFFNTLFQLLGAKKNEPEKLNAAEDLLFMPDLIGYLLTGNKVQERTIASTSQLYNPHSRTWDDDMLRKFGLPEKLFSEIIDPGTILGTLKESVSQQTGLGKVPVVTVAGHDTASAVVGTPSESETPAFLSSGTWSLMGLELPGPVINADSFEDAFTNEAGINGTTRFLKNICGLWLIQESRRVWSEAGEDVGYGEMAGLAAEAEPFRSLIFPDEERFAESGDMPGKIQEYCRETGQLVPETKGQVIRCIYESLALRCAEVWEKMVPYANEVPSFLSIVGGGSQESLLNQFIANSLGVTVFAGPVEATGLGNIVVQMMSNGLIPSLKEGRALIRSTTDIRTFGPDNYAEWAAAKEKFRKIQLN